MRKGTATILQVNAKALRMVASGARISTQRGTALEIFDASGDRARDLRLVEKVLSSGHESVLEHQCFGVAFDNVSVLVEQFCIEFRLASFTVKSRRYVDFSDAGYVVPDSMSSEVRALYTKRSEALFGAYDALLELGIPKEDARFVLPYGFRSNFFMTLNARELVKLVGAMLVGRGSAYSELRMLGTQLKAQFDVLYPGLLDTAVSGRAPERQEKFPDNIEGPAPAGDPNVTLVSAPREPMPLLAAAMGFTGRFGEDELRELLNDARARELEYLNYVFRIDGLSLACVTHFTRHRMLSLTLHHEQCALAGGRYVLPTSIAAQPQARLIYEKCFAEQSDAAVRAKALGATDAELSYFALAGHTTVLLISMNARELLHFARLRCCNRAQWEIRGIARDLVHRLCETEARALFQYYGPTCAVTGKCPEGKMSCGHPVRIEGGMWIGS